MYNITQHEEILLAIIVFCNYKLFYEESLHCYFFKIMIIIIMIIIMIIIFVSHNWQCLDSKDMVVNMRDHSNVTCARVVVLSFSFNYLCQLNTSKY